MKPVNSKSLFSFICDQMEKLQESSISVEQAKAQANLAKQANNILKYELDRASVLMKIAEFNRENENNKVEIREIESKPFDKTI
jgi:hypothetical protein